MSFHHNAGAGAIYSALPGATDTGNPAIDKLVGVFAEVPDVSVFILSEPVERIFGELAIGKDLIVNFDACHSINEFCVSSYGKLGVNKPRRSRTFVNVSCSRLQREIRVIDGGGVVVRVDCGIVWTAAYFL